MEWKKNGYTIRMARKEEAEDYYVQNFCPLDKEVIRFTGCKDFFEREEVISSFRIRSKTKLADAGYTFKCWQEARRSQMRVRSV